jgi:hypothetical protein
MSCRPIQNKDYHIYFKILGITSGTSKYEILYHLKDGVARLTRSQGYELFQHRISDSTLLAA